ncbi:hypothetical protein BCR34DRAFT_521173 [Clohesyomyces aquaticus]|uniref:IDI-2 n=1 Tax=Clohesyomyces aquaticus TaxID=1231657 RepID=A0A1Y1YYS6_9PLEO|nr:hypothetical protein BCR34DRAFT_521173 [Clohesyomyces aquaticus]
MHLTTTLLISILAVSVSASASASPESSNSNIQRSGTPPGAPRALVNVHARSCASRQFGCDSGYCWRQCESGGKWCWLALSRGEGDWATCLKDSDCDWDPFADWACASASRPHGGCSC